MKLCLQAVLLGCSLLGSSCNNAQREITIDGKIIRGSITITKTDTIFEGAIEYFDSCHRLEELSNFHNNQRSGKSTIYYPNGKIEQVKYYKDGNLNGQVTLYDSLGKLLQKSTFWNGLPVGSQEFYKNGALHVYRFVSLENIPLYRAEYNKGTPLLESGSPLYYVTNVSGDDNNKRIELFIYLMRPPGKQLTYRIFDADTSKGDTVLCETLRPDSINEFNTIYLDTLKKTNKYLFKIEAYYPSNGRTRDNILSPSEMKLTMPGAGSILVANP